MVQGTMEKVKTRFATVKGVNQVLEYIGRYAYRVVISNSRITGYDAKEGKATYDYKDYKTTNMAAVTRRWP